MIITDTLKPTKRREGAPDGNNNRQKWKTAAERIQACKDIVLELEGGMPSEYLRTADWDTIVRYMKDYPVEFPSTVIADAIRVGKASLISTGYAGITGNVKSFNANAWKFAVMNMTNWKLKSDMTSDGQKIEMPVLHIPEEVE